MSPVGHVLNQTLCCDPRIAAGALLQPWSLAGESDTVQRQVQRENRVAFVPNSLLVVHVDIAVVPEQLAAFLAATRENAEASRNEPGVLRFDVLSDRADPGHVVLVEIYRDEAAAAAHKDTVHYQRWRDVVAPMMARPRQPTRYVNTSPDDADW